METRISQESDLDEMVSLATESQVNPERHIGYLGVDGDSIRSDVLGVEQWSARTSVLVDDRGALAGWLLGEKDEEMDRVWWWGPFLCAGVPDDRADALYVHASESSGAAQQEMAPDDRNTRVSTLAMRCGFRADEASAVLSYAGAGFGRGGRTVPVEDVHHREVAALHDQLFPGTHTTGQSLVDADEPRLVVVEDGRVVGYVAVEVHSDGTGYIDYLGVHPEWRQRGLGRRLVTDATDLLLEMQAASVHLTVREHNTAARSLYAALGFTHERLIRPFRKGFSLA
jgi:ribosomal protein S18 acetylase RimI-like enzyme